MLRLLGSNERREPDSADFLSERDPLKPLKINENIVPAKNSSKTKASKKVAAKKPSKVDNMIVEKVGSCSSIGKLDRTWFCIDPEANLSKTRELLSTFIAPLASRWSWRGYSGECPPESTVR
jgi:hypothetical protein